MNGKENRWKGREEERTAAGKKVVWSRSIRDELEKDGWEKATIEEGKLEKERALMKGERRGKNGTGDARVF